MKAREKFSSQPVTSSHRARDFESGLTPPRQRSRLGTMTKSISVPVSLAANVAPTSTVQNRLPVPDTTAWSPSTLSKGVNEDSNGTTYAPSIAASSTGVSSVFGRLRLESPMELSEIEESDTVVAPSDIVPVEPAVQLHEEDVVSTRDPQPAMAPLELADLKTSPPPQDDGEPIVSTGDTSESNGKREGLVNSPGSGSSATSTPTTAVSSSQVSSTPTAASSSQSGSTPPPKRRTPIPETEFSSPFHGQRRVSTGVENDITSPRHGLPKLASNYAVVPRVAQLKRTYNRRPLGCLYLNINNFVETRSFATRTLALGRESQLYRERGG